MKSRQIKGLIAPENKYIEKFVEGLGEPLEEQAFYFLLRRQQERFKKRGISLTVHFNAGNI
jgi:hypothetical protein